MARFVISYLEHTVFQQSMNHSKNCRVVIENDTEHLTLTDSGLAVSHGGLLSFLLHQRITGIL